MLEETWNLEDSNFNIVFMLGAALYTTPLSPYLLLSECLPPMVDSWFTHSLEKIRWSSTSKTRIKYGTGNAGPRYCIKHRLRFSVTFCYGFVVFSWSVIPINKFEIICKSFNWLMNPNFMSTHQPKASLLYVHDWSYYYLQTPKHMHVTSRAKHIHFMWLIMIVLS